MARRYEFYFRAAKQYFVNERSESVVFLFYRQKDINKIMEEITEITSSIKLTCEIMENTPFGSRM